MIIKQKTYTNIIWEWISSSVSAKRNISKLFLITIYTGILFFSGIIIQRWYGIGNIKEIIFRYSSFEVLRNYFESTSAKIIRIDINHKNYQRLAYKRHLALESGVLNVTDDDFVPANINYLGDQYKVDMRLKGTQNKHWKDDEIWSLKIKIKDNKTLFGMKRFAIQHPYTRNYLNEWYFHQMLKFSGLNFLRYDFISVDINGMGEHIYALEENFDKFLIENNKNRAGIIFKFEMNQPVDPYSYKKITEDTILFKQFEIVKNLLSLFMQNELTVSQVFDVDKLAMFFAINDLWGRHHASHLWNLRFYYNPITSLIEPVGYDENYILPLSQEKLLGMEKEIGQNIEQREYKQYHNCLWFEYVFKDRILFQHYIKALEKISDVKYLGRFFEVTNSEYLDKLKILHRDYPWYKFKGDEILYENRQEIVDFLYPFQKFHVYFKTFSPENNTIFLESINQNLLPVEMLEVTYKDSILLKPTKDELIIQAKLNSEPNVSTLIELELPNNILWDSSKVRGIKVEYSLFGASKVYTKSVIPWPDPTNIIFENDFIRQSPNVSNFKFLSINEDLKSIIFKTGEWIIADDLIIPKGYNVIAEGGLKLNLVNSSTILSYSQITFLGFVDNPISIFSSDSSGQGIVVMNAVQESLLRYVYFNNLSNPLKGGWNLTGSVTFYESPVKINNCQFSNNRSEDGLNIIKSEFEIRNTSFYKTLSDAFDGDFCMGGIYNSSFMECGNDAIDVSGSIVELQNIVINGVGDKGLSAGENSIITCSNIEINESEISITAKDLSEIIIEGISIHNSKLGFAAYQKKHEFGPGSVIVTDLNMDSVKDPYLIEFGSNLTLNGKLIEPNRSNVKDILYGVEYGKSSR